MIEHTNRCNLLPPFVGQGTLIQKAKALPRWRWGCPWATYRKASAPKEGRTLLGGVFSTTFLLGPWCPFTWRVWDSNPLQARCVSRYLSVGPSLWRKMSRDTGSLHTTRLRQCCHETGLPQNRSACLGTRGGRLWRSMSLKNFVYTGWKEVCSFGSCLAFCQPRERMLESTGSCFPYNLGCLITGMGERRTNHMDMLIFYA